MSLKFVQSNTLYLAGAGVVPGAVNIVLTSLTDIYGNTLTMSDFGSKGYITLEPDTTNEEAATFTSITANANGTFTLGGVSTMLAKSPYTETSGLIRGHSGGTKVVITDNVGFWNKFANVENNNVFTGNNTVPDPVGNTDIANKQWVLSVINGGNVATNNVIVPGNAGETVAAGELVYLKSSDGYWWKCDADDTSTIYEVKLGIAQGAGTATNAIIDGVLIYGEDANQSGLTIGGIYYASNTAGAISSSAGTNERIIGVARTTTNLYFDPYFNVKSFQSPVIRTYTITKSIRSSSLSLTNPSTTQFDITNPVGTTTRYTWDGTGTDPLINGGTVPVAIGQTVQIQAQNFNAANNGTFTVTGVGTNYFEVTNASVVAETNKTVGTGYIVFNNNWSKPENLAYIKVKQVGGGGGSGGADAPGTDESASAGGGGAAYSEKTIAASALLATETLVVGFAGLGGTNSGGNGLSGNPSIFGSFMTANGGGGGFGTAGGNEYLVSIGGSATGGDINIQGAFGLGRIGTATVAIAAGNGGNSMLGFGGFGGVPGLGGTNGLFYGSGGGGSFSNNGAQESGSSGANGVIIVEEYYK